VKDGKIHLHKVNGVKIAVPVTKMSVEDLEYVEEAAGISLDDDKPLSDIKRRSTLRAQEKAARSSSGITVEQKPGYDWFDFFLQCGVNPQICERYAQAFNRDQMGEENLPDITEKLLRNLGLKEGDILRVTKYLQGKYGRASDSSKAGVENGEEGGLFSGPGGALRNNTRKGRPAPPIQSNDVVDAKAFEQKTDDAVKRPAESTPTPLASAPTPERKVDGFEDNAWDVKPARQPASNPTPAAPNPPPPSAPTPAPQPPALTGSMGELSILDMPALRPEVPTPAPAQPPVVDQPPAPPAQQAPQGANSTLFDQVAAIKAMAPQQMAPPRMRPTPPQQQTQGGLIAPPPMRSSSAPMNPQQSAFGPPPPLQAQLTGYQPNMHTQVAPPGQSLQDLNAQRMQQQMQPQMTGFPQQQPQFQYPQQNGMMPQPTGMMPQPTGMMPQPTGMMPQPTGFQPQQQGFAPSMQPQPTGFQPGMQQSFQTGFQPNFQQNSQMPLQAQPTGFQGFSPSPLNPQATGVNRFLPPALQPQPTGFGQSPPPMPPMPPMPSMPTAQPLVPQKTGPPPPVRFGTQPAKKLTPQPTGRANLSKASTLFPLQLSGIN